MSRVVVVGDGRSGGLDVGAAASTQERTPGRTRSGHLSPPATRLGLTEDDLIAHLRQWYRGVWQGQSGPFQPPRGRWAIKLESLEAFGGLAETSGLVLTGDPRLE
jgi:hypothetical protein